MWFTFKLAFICFMIWHFIKWRVTAGRYKRRRKRRIKPTPLTPGEAMQRMTANDNQPNDLTKHIPIAPPASPIIANDTTPTPQQQTPRNTRLIDDTISALRNLGMTKAKAKPLVNQCYDTFKTMPTLQQLIKHCLQSSTA